MNATRTRRLARGAAQAILAVLVASLCASCARGPQSVSLSLSLTQGMERTIRFVTEQHISGLARSKAGPDVSTVSMVYRFHVTSVDAARTAKLVCTVVDAHSSRRSAVSDAYLKTLTGRSMVMTLDKDGHILALKDDAAQAFTFPGTPFARAPSRHGCPPRETCRGSSAACPAGRSQWVIRGPRLFRRRVTRGSRGRFTGRWRPLPARRPDWSTPVPWSRSRSPFPGFRQGGAP